MKLIDLLKKVDWDGDGFVTSNDADEAQSVINRLGPEAVADIESQIDAGLDQVAAGIGSAIKAVLNAK